MSDCFLCVLLEVRGSSDGFCFSFMTMIFIMMGLIYGKHEPGRVTSCYVRELLINYDLMLE